MALSFIDKDCFSVDMTISPDMTKMTEKCMHHVVFDGASKTMRGADILAELEKQKDSDLYKENIEHFVTSSTSATSSERDLPDVPTASSSNCSIM